MFSEFYIPARYFLQTLNLNTGFPHRSPNFSDLCASYSWSSMGDQTLASGYFASHSTGFNSVTKEIQGQILPQIHSFHTEVKRVLCRKQEKKKKEAGVLFLSLLKIIAPGLLLLSSSPLKFLDCFPVKGQATAPIANVKCKNTIAAKNKPENHKLTNRVLNSIRELADLHVNYSYFKISIQTVMQRETTAHLT